MNKVGQLVEGTSEALTSLADAASNKVNDCVTEKFQADTLAALRRLEMEAGTLPPGEAMVSGGASQAVPGTLQTSLGTSLTDLTSWVSTRASQASVDALASTLGDLAGGRPWQDRVDGMTERLGGHHSLMLRLQVERHLADGREDRLAVFFLPVASGGLLEYVRDVVAETIAQKEALGLPVYSARALLWDGDAARAVRDFQRSSRRYGQAYRMATHAIAGEIAPEQD